MGAQSFFRDIGLPLAGVAETILSKGKSPGTTALGIQQRLVQQEQIRKQQERQARQDALARQTGEQKTELFKLKKGALERQTLKEKEREARLGAFRKQLGQPDVDVGEITERFMIADDPVTGAQFRIKRQERAASKEEKEAKLEAANLDRTIKGEDDLRKEMSREGNVFKGQADAFERVIASAEDPSAAGDLALIFNFMKILDPGSTVREGEFATAANSAGIPDRIRASYNNAIRGTRLSGKTRVDFVDRSIKLFKKAKARQDRIEGNFRGIAERRGWNFENILLDIGSVSPLVVPPTAGQEIGIPGSQTTGGPVDLGGGVTATFK